MFVAITPDAVVLVFTASFGPGGFRATRVRRNGGGDQQAGGQQQGEQSIRSVLTQLIPILLLFAFTILSAVPNIFSTPPTPDPRFSFAPSTRYSQQRQTNNLGVQYHVNPNEFSAHPIASSIATAEAQKQRSPLLDRFENTVERTYTRQLYNDCQLGMDRKQRRKEAKSGFLGIGADWDAIKKIDEEKVQSCEELRRFGLLT